MSDLIQTPYSYAFNDVVLVRVASTNTAGTSDYASNLIGATIRQAPSAVATPTVVSYSDLYANISWTALTGDATGQSPITAYNLYWNAGSGTVPSTLVTSALITSYQFTNLVGGTTYYFKVTATNIYGTGADSPVINVVAIDTPGKMSIPSVANSGTNVVVTYSPPTTHSSPITGYDIQFLKSDGTTATLACTESDLTAGTTCTVSTASVKTLTSLAVDTLIRVKVKA
jgi:Fibronectin type III domain